MLRCLAYEPAKRYPTAASLAADLRRFLEDRPIRARRVSWLERAGRWCRRNPLSAMIAGLAATLLTALGMMAAASHLQTRKAYAESRKAFQQAETTSQLALEVLDGIYAPLSPERIWLASDADPAAQACACIGLRAGDDSASSVDRTSLQVRASHETALLLENLLVFYDRLAAEGGDGPRLRLQSAVASRRVGDIRLCLGRIDQAEQDYLRAIEKLTALRATLPDSLECAAELARNYNEVGSVRSARRETRGAWQSHQAALRVLQSCSPAQGQTAEYRYELARTFYFLAGKIGSIPAGAGNHPNDARNRRVAAAESAAEGYRQSAIRILEELTRDHPRAPDYRLLLALCHRDTAAAPGPAGTARSSQGRQQAIRILEDLVAEYPAVADYRYELAATYAWIPVSLFPWQGRLRVSAEDQESLRKAVAESERLAAGHPAVPHYARSEALVLAKLATACWTSRRLDEAESLFRRAAETQGSLVARFPDLPPHDRALLAFFRVRLAQVGLDRASRAADRDALAASRQLLEQADATLSQLAERPDAAADQLVRTSLPLAHDALGNALQALGQPRKAENVKETGKAASPIAP